MIALFGTTLGLAVGSFFGWAVVRALRDESIDQFTHPIHHLAVVTAIACLAGSIQQSARPGAPPGSTCRGCGQRRAASKVKCAVTDLARAPTGAPRAS